MCQPHIVCVVYCMYLVYIFSIVYVIIIQKLVLTDLSCTMTSCGWVGWNWLFDQTKLHTTGCVWFSLAFCSLWIYKECNRLPWGFPGQPTPVPVKTCTCVHGCRLSWVWVMGFIIPTGTQTHMGLWCSNKFLLLVLLWITYGYVK